MNRYETVIIITDKINEDERKAVIDKIKTYVSKCGEIIEEDYIGLKRLAYEIQKCKQGYYFRMFFNAEPEMVEELERIYRITDEVIKFITIKHKNDD